MRSIEPAPVLAEAADLFGGPSQALLQRLAALLVRSGGLERRFLADLRRERFDARQRKALAALTLSAAARILARGRPLADFFEQVAYNGRRLAKLNVPPDAVLETLREHERLLSEKLRREAPRDLAGLRWAREQLSFCIVLTLNNAFYEVREAETQAFFELSRAELASTSPGELLGSSLAILTRFCRAEEGRLFFLIRPDGAWQRMAAEPRAEAPAETVHAPAGELSKPQYLKRNGGSGRLLLDASWQSRYASFWSIPFFARKRLAGVLQFAFSKPYEWLPRELQLLTAAAERALLASDKARLTEELAVREEQVRQLAAHMLQVEEAERRRISRELHDDTGQMLLCLRLQLEMLERTAPPDSAELTSGLDGARRMVEQTIVEVRRILSDLSPAVLDQLGLAAALRQLVSRFRRLHPIGVNLRMAQIAEVPKKTATVIYRLVQECCSNAARHSSAKRLNISLTGADGVLRLRVKDNGVGFEVEQALAKGNSFGLAGMRERVALLGGKCGICSQPGRGTVISIELPKAGPLRRPPAQPVPAVEATNHGKNPNCCDR